MGNKANSNPNQNEFYHVWITRDTETGVVVSESWRRAENGVCSDLERCVYRDRNTGAVTEEYFGRDDGLMATREYGPQLSRINQFLSVSKDTRKRRVRASRGAEPS